MATTQIQYDLTTAGNSAAAYEGTHGPEKAVAVDYKKNPGLHRLVLKDFRPPVIQVYR